MTNRFLRSAACSATVAATALCASAVSASDFKTLGDEDLKSAVTGKTLRLETQIGAIPISFRADGTMTGRSSDLASYLGRGYDTGSWWVDNNQLCQKWKLWMDAKSYCFTLKQAGPKVQWTRSDGLKGTLTVSN
jgi:hypothetical protein